MEVAYLKYLSRIFSPPQGLSFPLPSCAHLPSTLSWHDDCDCVCGMNIHALGCCGGKVGKRRLSLSRSLARYPPIDHRRYPPIMLAPRPHLPSFRAPQSQPEKVKGTIFLKRGSGSGAAGEPVLMYSPPPTSIHSWPHISFTFLRTLE